MIEESKIWRLIRLQLLQSPKVARPGIVAFPGGAGRVGVALKIDEEKTIARAAKLAKENKHTILCVGLIVGSP